MSDAQLYEFFRSNFTNEIARNNNDTNGALSSPACADPIHLRPSNHSIPMRPADVFEVRGVYGIRCGILDPCLQGSDIEREMRELPDFIPGEARVADETIRIDKCDVEHTLRDGFDWNRVELREDVDLRSSVRLFAPPSCRQFGVFARQNIQPGQVACPIEGTLTQPSEDENIHDTLHVRWRPATRLLDRW